MKRISIVSATLLAVLVIDTVCVAQKVGSSSMQFLKVMPVARATAMGDAYTAIASGAEAVFWNPAGLASLDGHDLSLTYLSWIFDTQQGALAYAISLGDVGNVGLQLQYIDFGVFDEAVWDLPYKEADLYPGLTGQTFHPYAYLIGATYAAQITDKFQTGIAMKYATESLYDGRTVKAISHAHSSRAETLDVNTWANGIMFDFGLRYFTGFRSVTIAASLQNFGPNVRYAVETNPIPVSLRLGVSADLIGSDALFMASEGTRLGLAFDLFQPNDYAQQAHVGIELEVSEVFALRIGNKFGYDADGLTMGLGVHQPLSGVQFSFDYSFASLRYQLGSVHRISMGVAFQ